MIYVIPAPRERIYGAIRSARETLLHHAERLANEGEKQHPVVQKRLNDLVSRLAVLFRGMDREPIHPEMLDHNAEEAMRDIEKVTLRDARDRILAAAASLRKQHNSDKLADGMLMSAGLLSESLLTKQPGEW